MYGEVISTRQLTAQMVRVVLGGVGRDAYTPAAGADQYVNCQFLGADAPQEVPFDEERMRERPREERPWPRRITVRAWDAAARQLILDIAVHGDVGHAGPWALSATPGDRLQMRGPAGDHIPDPSADIFLFVGDESALPAISACAESLPHGKRAFAFIEVEDAAGELELTSPADLEVHWVHRAGKDDLDMLLADAVDACPDLVDLPGVVDAFVHGEAVAIRNVRRVALSRGIVDLAQLSCSPYWRRGYDDEAWRSIKGAWVREVAAEEMPGPAPRR